MDALWENELLLKTAHYRLLYNLCVKISTDWSLINQSLWLLQANLSMRTDVNHRESSLYGVGVGLSNFVNKI